MYQWGMRHCPRSYFGSLPFPMVSSPCHLVFQPLLLSALSLRPGWLSSAASYLNSLGNNKESTKFRQWLKAVPTGESQTCIPQEIRTLSSRVA